MNWQQAYQLIITHIIRGLSLDPNLQYGRIIIDVPPYTCLNYDYNGSSGFKVQIGINNFIEIPISLLETVFTDAISPGNNRMFNKNIFRIHYPTRAEQKTGHPCYVQVVGKIFELAGVAIKINNRNYQIL